MRRPFARSLRFAALSTLAVGGLALFARPAAGVVEQTDGIVVPVQVANCPGSGDPNGCIQVGLNLGEGLPATSTTNPLDAVFDAATSPEIFAIPETNGVFGVVQVDDVIEGAGFENSFGWYNVDDPSQLYVITPCSDEPGSSRFVDFEVELLAGRYLGGFIGFFLITPEDAPIANNCGSLGNVGHLYYTEQAKNGDGNYVHYLVYSSIADPTRYYFGFEDLYRGGDNDYEDMFLRVTGLVKPCEPEAEVCDGADNNCDGIIDNDPVDAGGVCGLTDVGACDYGLVVCQGGALVCVGAVGPTGELCNGVDDDCDGTVDDAPLGEGNPCGSDVGECTQGAQTCIGGVFVCLGGTGPSLEVCNEKDDDCDGTIDEATVDTGGPCGTSLGVCEPGVLVCNMGVIECDGGAGGGPELCNGLDDDCNGAIDDGNPEGGAACGSDLGICESGLMFCVGGELVCIGAKGPQEELCDGLDNDCDGVADDLAVCPNGSQCVEGFCASPCGGGEFPCPGGQICVNGFCLEDSCEGVSCGQGFVCDQGLCVPDGSGGGGPGGAGGAGGGGDGGAGEGASAGSSSGGGAQGGAGRSGDTWGLATGGGGLFCAMGARGRPGVALTLGALALALAARRRARRGGPPITRGSAGPGGRARGGR
jgi:hypothetical protein